MIALAPCPSCRRHVRVVERACPFCGDAIAMEPRAARVIGQRLGRAALFTFGAAIATTAGCGTSTTPGNDAGTGMDANDLADVGHDVGGSVGDVYGAPPHDTGAMFPDSAIDAGTTPTDDAGFDADFVAPYGTPPPPPEPPER